jgi:hypothetical protein
VTCTVEGDNRGFEILGILDMVIGFNITVESCLEIIF